MMDWQRYSNPSRIPFQIGDCVHVTADGRYGVVVGAPRGSYSSPARIVRFSTPPVEDAEVPLHYLRTCGRSGAFKHDPEILEGMARLAFSDAWASKQEERGRSLSQQNIYEVAPRTNSAAKAWAKKQADAIVVANGGRSLSDLYEVAEGFGYSGGKEQFGNDLAFTSLGHGVHWTDDIPFDRSARDAIKIPHSEFSY